MQTLSFNDFKTHIISTVTEKLGPDYILGESKKVTDNKSEVLLIIVPTDKQPISLSLTDLYTSYQFRKPTMDYITDLVFTIINGILTIQEEESLDISRIVFRLYSKEKAQNLLDYSPHLPFMDMFLFFYSEHTIADNMKSYQWITNEIMDYAKLSLEDLAKAAYTNTFAKYAPYCVPGKELAISGICEELRTTASASIEEYQEGFNLILRFLNDDKIIGNLQLLFCKNTDASISIINTPFLQKQADYYHADLYVLPDFDSSFCFIPCDEDITLEDVIKFIRNPCNTITKPPITSHVFVFRRDTGRLEIAGTLNEGGNDYDLYI